jgi:hypothetical protein
MGIKHQKLSLKIIDHALAHVGVLPEFRDTLRSYLIYCRDRDDLSNTIRKVKQSSPEWFISKPPRLGN